ncbi:MAG: GtrA family protein [Stellaceae bacterium]|jgi:putative flippase GtrA
MQFFLYLIVGGLSFLVEIAAFVALRRAAMPVIPASVASYVVATLANYLLSVLLAFQRGRFRRHVEMARFLTVVLVGLALNTALVWCFVYPLAIPPLAAKIGAVPIVLIWNYLGRRMLVFTDRVPAPVQSWVDAAGRARFGLPPLARARNAEAQRANGQAVRSRSTSAKAVTAPVSPAAK